MKSNSMQNLTKSALLFISALFVISWLPASYLRPFHARSGTGHDIPTIFHNDSATPIETQAEIPKSVIDSASPKHAYVFYATSPAYACSALVNIDRLRNKFNSTYRMIVIAKPTIESEFLNKFISYNVTVLPYEPPPIPAEYPYYADVLLKLVSFRLHQYIPSLERVLVLDADQLVVQSLDHLFSLPSVDLAAPRVYWGDDPAQFTSAMMLIKLSDRVWNQVNAGMESVENYKFDMDIVNNIFRNFTMILPGDYCTLNSHFEDNWLPAWYEGNEWAKSQEKAKQDKRAEATPIRQEQNVQKRGRVRDERELLQYREISESKATGELSELSPAQKEEVAALRQYQASLNKEHLKSQTGENEASETPQEELSIAPVPAPASVEMSSDEQASKQTSELRWRKHDLMGPLQKIYDEEVKVLHYTAGKPWSSTENQVRAKSPDAHPLLAEQFRTWRLKAKEVCPGFEGITI